MTRRAPSLTALGWPCTWTGRVVSPEALGRLSEWDRYGPDGRVWSGLLRAWVTPEEHEAAAARGAA